MGLDDDIAILAAAPVFGFLDRDALRLLSFAAERRELRAGDRLFGRGEPADGGFVVMSVTVPRRISAQSDRCTKSFTSVIGVWYTARVDR